MLDILGIITLADSLTKSSNTKPIFGKVLRILRNFLNIVLKLKNKMLLWVQDGCILLVAYPHDHMVAWELWLTSAQHHKRACMLSSLRCVWFFVTTRTIAYQAPLFMKFSRQDCWSGLPFHSATHDLNFQADSLPLYYLGSHTAYH